MSNPPETINPEALGLARAGDVESKLLSSAKPMRLDPFVLFEGVDDVSNLGELVTASVTPAGSVARLRLDNGQGYAEISIVYGRVLQLGDELVQAGRAQHTRVHGRPPATIAPPLPALDEGGAYSDLGQLGLSLTLPRELDPHDRDPDPAAAPLDAVTVYLRVEHEDGPLVVRLVCTCEQLRSLGMTLKNTFRQLTREGLVDLTVSQQEAAVILARDKRHAADYLAQPNKPARSL